MKRAISLAIVAALALESCELPSLSGSVAIMGSQSTASGNYQIAFSIVDGAGSPVPGIAIAVTLARYEFAGSTDAGGFFKVPVYFNDQWGQELTVRLTFPESLAITDVIDTFRALDAAGNPLRGCRFSSNFGPLGTGSDGILEIDFPFDAL